MTLRLSQDEDRALSFLAAAQGSSKHEAAVRAIVTAASRMLDDARVTELARDTVAEVRHTESRIRQARAGC